MVSPGASRKAPLLSPFTSLRRPQSPRLSLFVRASSTALTFGLVQQLACSFASTSLPFACRSQQTATMSAAAATCRLEIMGVPDSHGYRRHARGILSQGYNSWSGLNIPNKKPGEPLLEWAQILREELPKLEICVHYSVKHQRDRGDPVSKFERFCQDAVAIGVKRVLLVTGPRNPGRADALTILEGMKGRHPAPNHLRLGVAFNACLPTEQERKVERARLVRKLQSGLVKDVWLNTASDTQWLQEGAAFVKQAAEEVGEKAGAPLQLELFGSVLRPNEAQLWQMNERPWNGVSFSEDYLGSVEGMWNSTLDVLSTFAACGVEPIVESKVRSAEELAELIELLKEGKAKAPNTHADSGTGKAAQTTARLGGHRLSRPTAEPQKGKGGGKAAQGGGYGAGPPTEEQKPSRRWGRHMSRGLQGG
eukprot:TRINITY_DN52257_c0_g1_i1.p1 TRINITY_DN52257_c0_g1~~TRINITY_DN52257_c0_g1_i1.p1  ORF type:complete len:422 (+),score=77.18 TRINITY_DN52257_c0_g1_i1:57-1322(+)